MGESASIPTEPGTYLLLLQLSRSMTIRVGALGKLFFNKGNYLYVGSALGRGGLRARISRHINTRRKLFWHIDYLLQYAKVLAVYLIESKEKLECKIAKELTARGIQFVSKFGSSDCNCRSHLFIADNVRKIEETLRELDLRYNVVVTGEHY